MKIYIFGSNGMLGNYMKSYISNYYEVISLTRNDYDLNNLSIVSLTEFLTNKNIKENDLIINCAGVIPQASKQREQDSKLYFKINSLFPVILSMICEKFNTKMIHITTDCVFSGKTGNYHEVSQHDETNEYGISKSLGELCNATIIRTSIIGEELNNKISLLEWVRSNEGKKINGFTTHMWNGVTCLQLAKIVYQIINDKLYWNGIRHIFSPRSVSKYELVSLINEVYQLNIDIIPLETELCDKTLSTVYDTNSLFDIPDLVEQIKKIKYNYFYK
uniref:RmlD-like substrate binding domain-containing protein n=1 Tax=viral metagenome TaxID=1070528 RepID=A0A6C0ILD8_9ZZZZ